MLLWDSGLLAFEDGARHTDKVYSLEFRVCPPGTLDSTVSWEDDDAATAALH